MFMIRVRVRVRWRRIRNNEPYVLFGMTNMRNNEITLEKHPASHLEMKKIHFD